MNRLLNAFCQQANRRLLLACWLLLAVSAPAWTDEHDEPHTTSDAATDESPRPRDNTSFEVFVPSEQISEDIPVPFPVDI